METPTVLYVDDLTVSYRRDGARLPVLKSVSLEVEAGQVMGLVGESGCGKTTAALHMLGYRPANSHVEGGRILLRGRNILSLDDRELALLRGRRISYVPQNPATALNPARRIGSLIIELLMKHRIESTRVGARERAGLLLRQVGLPAFEAFLDRFPYQLSGGQQQRVGVAMAIACSPDLVVLDEPTTGLDVSTQRQVIDLLESIRQSTRLAMVYVTHDLELLREIATHVAVMYAGRIVEVGRIKQLYQSPQHPYTRGLMMSVPSLGLRRRMTAGLRGLLQREQLPIGCAFAPRCDYSVAECAHQQQALELVTADHVVACQQWRLLPPWAPVADSSSSPDSPGTATGEAPILEVTNLHVGYVEQVGFRFFRPQARDVVQGFNVVLRRGETYALVGESGSGKSTIAKAISGLLAPSGGTVCLDGEPLGPLARHRTHRQRRRLQMVFQNPDGSLNPRHRVGQILADAVRSFYDLEAPVIRHRIEKALHEVRLPLSAIRRFPDELSGGERQRVAIARALIVDPDVLLCDEILSALDVSVQAGIVELLRELQSTLGLGIVFICHDLAVVRALADRIGVIYQGSLVESGRSEAIFAPPYHPYTLRILSAVPGYWTGTARSPPDRAASSPMLTASMPANLCPFLALCPVQDPNICGSVPPPRRSLGPDKEILCHHAAAALIALQPALRLDVDQAQS